MPAPTTVPEFLDLVRRSQLLPESKVDECVNRHRSSDTIPQTIDQIASLLVREAQITFFQAKQIKLGRYKRFTIGSKYRLLELIGAGGMGAVYLCEHTLMRRLVALKVLPVEKLEDESNKERFYREARAVAALDHPNIVRAYDIDTFEKLHFLVMEYVDGASLQEVVARHILDKKLFDPIRSAHYIAQAAIGMQHAHELGMVHRDIKPGNLLLDRTGTIKVLDMGLARFFHKQQDSVTEKYDQNCVLGTADYLAPEQAVSNKVDIRADIYALGGTFYFMLTGQTPFPDGTIAAKLVAHQTREPRSVDTFRSDVPKGLLAVLRKMMARSLTERFQNPTEVVDALSEWSDIPIDLPLTREMPIHCPLVQSLATPGTMGTTSNSSVSRALLGTKRGVLARAGGGGSSVELEAKLLPGSTGKYNPSDSKSNAKFTRKGTIPLGGSAATEPSAAAPTAPLQNSRQKQNDSSRISEPLSGSSVVYLAPPRRTKIYILVGVLFTLLFLAGSMAAYYLGKRGKSDSPSSAIAANSQTVSSLADIPGLTPGPADKLLSPVEAALKIGEIQTVEFKVASMGGTGFLALNSQTDGKKSGNLAVRIEAFFFQGSGNQGAALWTQTQSEYNGKVIRARGKLMRDEVTKGTYLEVRTPKQILIVPDH